MSVTIKRFDAFEVTVGGELKEGGSRETAVEITAASEVVFDFQATVADNYQVETLWQNAAPMTDFDFLWFISDQDVYLELVLDRATVPSYRSFKVAANVPFCMATDDMVAVQLTEGAAEGAAVNQIDQINCKRDVADAIGDAQVRLVLLT